MHPWCTIDSLPLVTELDDPPPGLCASTASGPQDNLPRRTVWLPLQGSRGPHVSRATRTTHDITWYIQFEVAWGNTDVENSMLYRKMVYLNSGLSTEFISEANMSQESAVGRWEFPSLCRRTPPVTRAFEARQIRSKLVGVLYGWVAGT